MKIYQKIMVILMIGCLEAAIALDVFGGGMVEYYFTCADDYPADGATDIPLNTIFSYERSNGVGGDSDIDIDEDGFEGIVLESGDGGEVLAKLVSYTGSCVGSDYTGFEDCSVIYQPDTPLEPLTEYTARYAGEFLATFTTGETIDEDQPAASFETPTEEYEAPLVLDVPEDVVFANIGATYNCADMICTEHHWITPKDGILFLCTSGPNFVVELLNKGQDVGIKLYDRAGNTFSRNIPAYATSDSADAETDEEATGAEESEEDEHAQNCATLPGASRQISGVGLLFLLW